MHRQVFADGPDAYLTVGEMPVSGRASLFTDPARGEIDMVFQFEHVRLDQGANKWDTHPLHMRDLKASLGRWQAGTRRRRLELALLEQPRPAACRVPIR